MFSGRYMRSVVFTTLAVSIPTLSLQSQPKFTAFCAENSERKLYSDIAVESFRNSLSPASNFERLDVRLLESDHRQWVNNHALHETLKGDGKVEAYEVYRKKDSDEVVCLVIFGESLNGYPKIVHGGITALIFDNTYGWLFMALQKPPAVTANLSVNYRKPIRANTAAVLRAKLTSTEGRKMFMSATLEDMEGTVLAESSSLFISTQK